MLLAMNATDHVPELLSGSGPRFKSISLSLWRTTQSLMCQQKREFGTYPLKHIVRARQSFGTHFEPIGLTNGWCYVVRKESVSISYVFLPLFCKLRRKRERERKDVAMSRWRGSAYTHTHTHTHTLTFVLGHTFPSTSSFSKWISKGIFSDTIHPVLYCLQSYWPQQRQEIHIFCRRQGNRFYSQARGGARSSRFQSSSLAIVLKYARGNRKIHFRYLMYALSWPDFCPIPFPNLPWILNKKIQSE